MLSEDRVTRSSHCGAFGLNSSKGRALALFHRGAGISLSHALPPGGAGGGLGAGGEDGSLIGGGGNAGYRSPAYIGGGKTSRGSASHARCWIEAGSPAGAATDMNERGVLEKS